MMSYKFFKFNQIISDIKDAFFIKRKECKIGNELFASFCTGLADRFFSL